MAYMYGYKPKVTGLANTIVDVYQQVPAKLINNEYVPDYDYALYVDSTTSIQTTSADSTIFTLNDSIDFSVSNSLDPTDVSIAQLSGGNPQYYLLKKSRNAFSGRISSTEYSIGSNPQEFLTLQLNVPNIAGIVDIVDSNGNEYGMK